jgi:CheY-like chemotaxis protein/glycine cleavage system H lipoate-binding protein
MEKTVINILVVDDEQIVLDSIMKHLRHESDYIVKTANSVEDALKIIDESAIDIILTDLMMPEIDGLEFLKLLKVRKDKNYHGSLITIMITGYATINTALQAMQNGAFDYIAKPFTRDELKKIVRRAAEIVASAVSVQGKVFNRIGDRDDQAAQSLKGIGENSWMMLQDDDILLIGVERPFLYSIGKIQTVYLPSMGDELRQGSVYFQLFSSDLRTLSLQSPFSGIVVEINDNVNQDPNKYLQDPYGEGWLLKLKPTQFDEEVKILGLL